MPRIQWLTTYEALDPETMQEVHVTSDGKMRMDGKVIKFCYGGRHWVPEHDYEDYCLQGFHEFAKTIDLPQKS